MITPQHKKNRLVILNALYLARPTFSMGMTMHRFTGWLAFSILAATCTAMPAHATTVIELTDFQLADMAEENAGLRAKYDGLVAGVKALKNKIREEEKRHAGGRKSGGAGAGSI